MQIHIFSMHAFPGNQTHELDKRHDLLSSKTLKHGNVYGSKQFSGGENWIQTSALLLSFLPYKDIVNIVRVVCYTVNTHSS